MRRLFHTQIPDISLSNGGGGGGGGGNVLRTVQVNAEV